jgi:hypothetical protein
MNRYRGCRRYAPARGFRPTFLDHLLLVNAGDDQDLLPTRISRPNLWPPSSPTRRPHSGQRGETGELWQRVWAEHGRRRHPEP